MSVLRFLLLALFVLLLTLLLLAASAWAFRDSLAAFAFHRWAEARGLDGEIAGLELDFGRLEVQGLRLEGARLARVEARFSLQRLVRGEVKSLLLQGLHLPLDLSGEGPLLGRLQPLLGESNGNPEQPWQPPFPKNPPPLPKIGLQDAQLQLNSVQGPLLITLQGQFTPEGADLQDHLFLEFKGEAEGPEVSGRLEASLANLRPQSLHAEMGLAGENYGRGSLWLDAPALRAGEEMEIVARLEGAGAELAAFFPNLPEVTSGQLDVALDGRLRLPPLPYLDVEPPTSWLAWIAERDITAQFDLAGQELDVPSFASDITFFSAIAAERGAEGTTFHLEGPLELHAAGFGPAVLSPLPETLAARLKSGASLSLHSVPSLPLLSLGQEKEVRSAVEVQLDVGDGTHLSAELQAVLPRTATSADVQVRQLAITTRADPLAERLHLAGEGKFAVLDKAVSGDINLSLTAEDIDHPKLNANRLEMHLQLRADWLESNLHLVLREEAALSGSELSAPGVERLEELEMFFPSLALSLELSDSVSGSLSAEAYARSANLLISGLGPSELLGPALRLEADFDESGLLQGSANVAGSSLYLPEQEVTLADIRIEAPLSPNQSRLLTVQQARLYSDAVPALFPPLNLTGHVERNLQFELVARGAEGAINLVAQGQHDPELHSGSASLRLAPLRFAPGELQPSLLSSHAADISDGRGQLQADGRVTWSSAGFNGSLRMRAQELGFTYGGTALDGISFDFRIASLRPLRTSEPQRLDVRRIDLGVTPITDATLFLSLEPTRSGLPVLRLEQGQAKVTGGSIRLVGGSADPGAQLYSVRIELQQLDLEALLGLIGLDELTGSGRISGNIPVQLQGDTVTVDQGQLQAEGPGVIAFRSSAARSALAAGGEYVSLMFDALENFHYDALEIGLTKPPEGTTQIRLRLLGANPDVMDAQPFDLNINVQTNAAPLLEALAESRRLQQGVTEQLWRLVR